MEAQLKRSVSVQPVIPVQARARKEEQRGTKFTSFSANCGRRESKAEFKVHLVL